VPLDHAHPFDNDALRGRFDGDDPAAFAFIRARDDYYFVVLFYVLFAHRFWRSSGIRIKSKIRRKGSDRAGN
jgi:hypothetical protein